jgi:hypothetical protein
VKAYAESGATRLILAKPSSSTTKAFLFVLSSLLYTFTLL